jgi:Putative porin
MLNRVFTDTLKADYRTSGTLLDSADCFGFTPIVALPGSLSLQLSEFSYAKRFDPSLPLLNNSAPLIWRKSSFIAMPHLGISYNFGSNATQQMRAEYQQRFNLTNFLQITYKRETSSGFLQNGQAKATNVQVNGAFDRRKYQLFYDASFLSSELGENGGIFDKNEVLVNGLELSSVNKNSAKSFQKRANVLLDQRFSIADSGKNNSGVVHHFEYDIQERQYTETGNLFSAYPQIFHDSTRTRDLYNLGGITNGLGYFLNTKNLYFDVTAQHRYWSQYTVWFKKDTNEFALSSRFSLRLKQLKLSNSFKFNVVGALGEWKNELELAYNKSERFSLTSKLLVGTCLPNPYQRNYTSNHYEWNLANLKLQNYQQILVSAQLPKAKNFFIDFSFLNVGNPYILDSNVYKRTAGVFSVLGINTGFTMAYKALRVRPTVLFQTGSELSKLPQIQGNIRIQMIQKWVKKRLPVSYGIDLSYTSGYSSYTYLPILNQLQANNGNVNAGNLVRLHAFFALEISSFRFFTRIENIDYIWNNRNKEVVVNYPILPRMIRLGITWDFFN